MSFLARISAIAAGPGGPPWHPVGTNVSEPGPAEGDGREHADAGRRDQRDRDVAAHREVHDQFAVVVGHRPVEGLQIVHEERRPQDRRRDTALVDAGFGRFLGRVVPMTRTGPCAVAVVLPFLVTGFPLLER